MQKPLENFIIQEFHDYSLATFTPCELSHNAAEDTLKEDAKGSPFIEQNTGKRSETRNSVRSGVRRSLKSCNSQVTSRF